MFQFFLSDETHIIKEGGEEWHHSFPVTRKHPPLSSSDRFSYGDYFSSVRHFLENDSYKNLVRAASLSSGKDVRSEEIEHVSVFLVKHGEYYHPSKVEVSLSGEKQVFVLNVAVTDQGTACMEKERDSLMYLNREVPSSYLPDMFTHGSVFRKNKQITMMMGAWFENYHEFHLSVSGDNEKAVIVWDPVLGNRRLPKSMEKELYRQTSKILTFFYNPVAFSKINSWHHAAGDFVLKRDDNKIDVKLITVRSYGSPFTGEDEEMISGIEVKLDALFVFFVNLSIRMRIDRNDGTGEFVWSSDTAVPGTVQGFFEGMAAWRNKSEHTYFWTDSFVYYLSRQKKEDLRRVANDIISFYHPDAPDTRVAKQNIGNHINSLFDEINHVLVKQDESSTT